jgi:hypothetical protein
MSALPPTVPLPSGFTPLIEQVHAQLGDSLVALLMFGSCLSTQTRQPGSVPDLLAFVGDLGVALRRLGCGSITRALAGWLPPLTLALRDQTPAGRGRPLAKLNLIELPVAQQVVRELPDLYLAGRLSKPTAWLWHRDPACRATIEALLQEAATAVAELTLRGLAIGDAPIALDAVVQLYIGQSYLAEIRPEGQEKWRALRLSFPAFYEQRVRTLLLDRAPSLGLRPLAPSSAAEPTTYPAFRDERPPTRRQADHQARAQLIRRSRLRTIARWPKMALVYRGWLLYLLGKLQRVWRQRLSARPENRAT